MFNNEGMNTTNQIIACIVLAAFIFLLYFLFNKRRRKDMKAIKARNEILAEKKEFYHTFTQEQFDNCPDDDLVFAVLSHIDAKEQHAYSYDEIVDVINFLTDGEKKLYSLNKIEQSISGKGHPSVYKFFTEEQYIPYIPYVHQAFIDFDVPELAEVYDSAREFADIVINDKEDNMTGKYSRYNFTDYTTELNTVMRSSGLVNRAAIYIRNHPEEFVDTDYIIEEYEKNLENKEGE